MDGFSLISRWFCFIDIIIFSWREIGCWIRFICWGEFPRVWLIIVWFGISFLFCASACLPCLFLWTFWLYFPIWYLITYATTCWACYSRSSAGLSTTTEVPIFYVNIHFLTHFSSLTLSHPPSTDSISTILNCEIYLSSSCYSMLSQYAYCYSLSSSSQNLYTFISYSLTYYHILSSHSSMPKIDVSSIPKDGVSSIPSIQKLPVSF